MISFYPSSIPCSGALEQSRAFGYFRGATQAFLDDIPQNEYEPEYWGGVRTWMKSQTYPITRSAFNTIINNNFPESSDLLSPTEPTSSWPLIKVWDWAKIQSFILAMFGSNSATTSLSYLTGSVGSVVGWQQSNLVLLRHALTQFGNYGGCYDEDAITPPPTNPIVNVAARTFDWTMAPGYPNLSDYRFTMGYTGVLTVSTKPITIPIDRIVGAGVLQLWVAGNGYRSDSTSISNNQEYPMAVFGVTVSITVVNTGSLGQYQATISSEGAMTSTTTITVSGNASYQDFNGSFRTFTYSVTLNAGAILGTASASTTQQPPATNTLAMLLTANPSPAIAQPGNKTVRVFGMGLPI